MSATSTYTANSNGTIITAHVVYSYVEETQTCTGGSNDDMPTLEVILTPTIMPSTTIYFIQNEVATLTDGTADLELTPTYTSGFSSTSSTIGDDSLTTILMLTYTNNVLETPRSIPYETCSVNIESKNDANSSSDPNDNSHGKDPEVDEISSGLTGGVVAGAAIGCLIAGLILGFLAAFLYRKKKQQERLAPIAYVSAEPKEYKQEAMAVNPPQDVLQLNQFFALATPDKELSNELHSLGDLIQQHVENNYHLRAVHTSAKTLVPTLKGLGIVHKNEGLSAEDVAVLAIDPKTRYIALQHVIAHVLFRSIDFSSKSLLTMLPPPMAAFLHSIPPIENQGGNHEGTRTF